jgi:DNA-binding NarL/FixJ family response regulator
MSEFIRILLADDHPFVRAGIRATLIEEPDFKVVGEAETGDETQQLFQELQPDVVLLDLNMPGQSATETITNLRTKPTGAKVIVLTAYDDEAYIRAMITSGVDGYILKDEAPETVVQAIRMALLGGKWFSDSIVRILAQPANYSTGISPKDAGLTKREWQLLEALAHGWDNARIAEELQLADQTVRNYISHLYNKLCVETRAEAIVWAMKYGLGGK